MKQMMTDQRLAWRMFWMFIWPNSTKVCSTWQIL